LGLVNPTPEVILAIFKKSGRKRPVFRSIQMTADPVDPVKPNKPDPSRERTMHKLIDYIKTHCERDRGALIPFLEFSNGFRHEMPADERAVWPRKRVIFELNHIAGVQTGRSSKDGRHFVVGLRWRPECDPHRNPRQADVQGGGVLDALNRSPQNPSLQNASV
jgi:hypothetical protein